MFIYGRHLNGYLTVGWGKSIGPVQHLLTLLPRQAGTNRNAADYSLYFWVALRTSPTRSS